MKRARLASIALIAISQVGCAGVASQIETSASRTHGCPRSDVWVMREDFRPRGWWVNVCGTERFYVEDGGRFREMPRQARTPPPKLEGNVYRSRSGGPVRVRGYRRRDGTYVHPHTRHRPRH